MTDAFRRNACPSLSAPMPTGDGLLARLTTDYGIVSPAALQGMARSAEQHGSGILEITRRGSLQIRGLDEASAPKLRAALASLDLPLSSPTVQTGPLAGFDPGEISDPRSVLQMVATGLGELRAPLAAKMSVVIDGGGSFPLNDVLGDFRISATPAGWHVAIAGNARSARALGLASSSIAVETAMRGLEMLAAKGPRARARDLTDDDVAALQGALTRDTSPETSRRYATHPIGLFPVKGDDVALCMRLPFGQVTSAQMVALAEAAIIVNATEFRLSPNYALLALCPSANTATQLLRRAKEIGFIVSEHDPRLGIVTCAGAPGCASGRIATKALARDISMLDHRVTVHISGCGKRCAEPVEKTRFTIVGTSSGIAAIQDSVGKTLSKVAENEVLDAFRQASIPPASDKRRGERLATKRRNAEKRPDQFAGVGDRR